MLPILILHMLHQTWRGTLRQGLQEACTSPMHISLTDSQHAYAGTSGCSSKAAKGSRATCH